MRIGLSVNEPQATDDPLRALRDELRRAEDDGFGTAWLPNVFDIDALTAVAALSSSFPALELGTAVVPTHPRHPVALAQQSRTTQLIAEGRLTLGIGLSHRSIIENMFGLDYSRPASHMEEYLDVLLPLLAGAPVDVDGDRYSAHLELRLGAAPAVPVLLAAMGPRMLELAGARTEGTILWMTGANAIEGHIRPRLHAAAAAAGKSAPRIVCMLPICVTQDPDTARAAARVRFAGYEQAPSYRAMLELEGLDHAGDIAVIGSEDVVEHELERLQSVGVTDLVVVETGSTDDRRRTRDLLMDRR